VVPPARNMLKTRASMSVSQDKCRDTGRKIHGFQG
jgi:hypothetical protein